MHTQSYYRLTEDVDGCNILDHSHRLIVNCSGICALDASFKSTSARGRHDHYLMYVVDGELEASSGEASFFLRPGDVAFYRPDAPYAYQNVSGGRMVYLWVHFTGAEADHLLHERGLQTGHAYSVGISEEIEESFEAIQRLFITRPAFYLEEAASHMDLLLTRIGRAVSSESMRSPSERLHASLNHLNHHYAEPLKLDSLAAMEYLSASRYSALFRQIMGLSPQQYLIDLRLRNAREMLLSTDLSITEVARSVGYDDALYFSRLFRRHLGASPSEVRRERTK